MLQALDAQIRLTREQPTEALLIFRDLATACGLTQVVAIVEDELRKRARNQPRLAVIITRSQAGASHASPA
jgi:hypothetical protein